MSHSLQALLIAGKAARFLGHKTRVIYNNIPRKTKTINKTSPLELLMKQTLISLCGSKPFNKSSTWTSRVYIS